MRLIIKITLLFVMISSIVFLVGAVFSYNAMTNEIVKEERWFLEERMESVVRFLERSRPHKKITWDKVVITPLTEMMPETKPKFTDTLVTHVTLQRIEPHIKLDAIRHAGNMAYKIMIYDLIIEEDDIIDAVRESMTKTFLLLLGVSFLLSFAASYIVFRPFQETLARIKNFSIKAKQVESLPTSTTTEFKKLNQFIEEMMNKAQKDYQVLKEFSENASHEFQTPLSIAQGKLELLLQSGELTEDQAEHISSAQQAIRRLSKLSSALSLLTKIENKEFSDVEEVRVSEMLSNLLIEFNELITLKGLMLNSKIEEEVVVTGNAVLLEILFSNLLNNAVRHNLAEGNIELTLEKKLFVISNSGEALQFPPENYFQRFKKGSNNPDSTGLGLSIVKQICDQHGFDVSYEVKSDQHIIKVVWE